MATNLKCAKCGSAQVIPSAPVVSQSTYRGKVLLSVARKPDAFIFKGEELAEIRARVCGDCGHVEMFVREARALYRVHLASEAAQST